MNNSLLPENKIDISSKSLGLAEITSEKLLNFRLFHVDKLTKKQESTQKYEEEK